MRSVLLLVVVAIAGLVALAGPASAEPNGGRSCDANGRGAGLERKCVDPLPEGADYTLFSNYILPRRSPGLLVLSCDGGNDPVVDYVATMEPAGEGVMVLGENTSPDPNRVEVPVTPVDPTSTDPALPEEVAFTLRIYCTDLP